jgi:DNA-binding HxlR family transcriptional regulator
MDEQEGPPVPEPRLCSIAGSLRILGERWALLAIRELTYGVHRFDWIAGYTGASRNILADRLRALEDAGIVERRQYSQRPPRFEYHLTEAGAELAPVLLALSQWGDKWTSDPPVHSFDHDCGHALRAEYRCAHCHEVVEPDSVTLRPR